MQFAADGRAEVSDHKKGVELVGGRQDVAFAMEKYRLSERHACELNGLDRSTYRNDEAISRLAEPGD
jgi:hypothetical protein